MPRRAGEVSFLADCATTTLPLLPALPEVAALLTADPLPALEDEAAAPVPPPPVLHVHADGSCVPPVATAAIDATTATPRIREQTNSVRVGCQSRLPEAGCLNLRMCLTPSLSSLRIAPGRSERPVLSGARASLRASGVGGAVVGRLPLVRLGSLGGHSVRVLGLAVRDPLTRLPSASPERNRHRPRG